MNIAIYCGSSFGNKDIYQEMTIKLAQKLASENINVWWFKARGLWE